MAFVGEHTHELDAGQRRDPLGEVRGSGAGQDAEPAEPGIELDQHRDREHSLPRHARDARGDFVPAGSSRTWRRVRQDRRASRACALRRSGSRRGCSRCRRRPSPRPRRASRPARRPRRPVPPSETDSTDARTPTGPSRSQPVDATGFVAAGSKASGSKVTPLPRAPTRSSFEEGGCERVSSDGANAVHLGPPFGAGGEQLLDAAEPME